MSVPAYLIIDIGTGNARVAITQPDGTILAVATADIRYTHDNLYPNSIYFDPTVLWDQICSLAREALQQAADAEILAITATSQREGIVLIGKDGNSMIGLPNIDHRGREWEHIIADKTFVYQRTGRFPTSLFSAFKLYGIRERRMEIWENMAFFLSISDWIEYKLTGIAGYEHSQASETLLYDVEAQSWSPELLELFSFSPYCVPPLKTSGSVIGPVIRHSATELGINTLPLVVASGGDTQLAIKSTQPAVDDVVIVSGTTTPIVKVVDRYITDKDERTWTSRDIETGRFILEANAGVTGLNYQRLKEVFYPNEDYDQIERELTANTNTYCSASLGSLIASEKSPVTSGGFIFPVPVTHDLTRSCFVRATLMDIAFSIAENYKVLRELSGHSNNYVWACGGGMQSATLRTILAGVLDLNVQVRHGYRQSSAIGGALRCNEVLQPDLRLKHQEVEVIRPANQEIYSAHYAGWKSTRELFRKSAI